MPTQKFLKKVRCLHQLAQQFRISLLLFLEDGLSTLNHTSSIFCSAERLNSLKQWWNRFPFIQVLHITFLLLILSVPLSCGKAHQGHNKSKQVNFQGHLIQECSFLSLHSSRNATGIAFVVTMGQSHHLCPYLNHVWWRFSNKGLPFQFTGLPFRKKEIFFS